MLCTLIFISVSKQGEVGKISIGYACVTLGVPWPGQRGCIMRSATSEYLKEIIGHNLDSLENAVRYNIDNGILLYRISSDVIPFGSSPVNKLPWRDLFEERLCDIGAKILKADMRVSMHPGQYTVLNSADPEISKRAEEDLIYHSGFLDSLGLGREHKVVLHVGGVYGNKKQAGRRFIERFRELPMSVASRIVIENDDRAFNIGDILEIAGELNIPAVYDNLHNRLNPTGNSTEAMDIYWIKECAATWRTGDGNGDGHQKIHYSQQDASRRQGSHSNSINTSEFMIFYKALEKAFEIESKSTISLPDIMLEVKDKNISSLKCINCTVSPMLAAGRLETEWGRYKYRILEKSPAIYGHIRSFFREQPGKTVTGALEFYEMVEEAENLEAAPGNAENAALHVWGYFKNTATESEKAAFLRKLEAYRKGEAKLAAVKNHLWKIALKYRIEYLLNSYYFLR